MDFGLADKRALVTGSTAGIGWATARALAAEGAEVILNGRTETRLQPALDAVRREISRCTDPGVAADLSTFAGCAALIDAAPEVDILVNNMGISYVCSTQASATTGAALRVDGGVVRAIV